MLGVALCHLEIADAPTGRVSAVFVTPNARKNGAGSALVEHVTSRARTLGHQKLFLYTEHAQDWYLSKGWRKVRDTIFLGLHHTVMQLDLVI